jgi:uncharacterized protein (TIRG00374 family)
MSGRRTEELGRRARNRARPVVGWLLAIGSLLWIFHDVHPRAFRGDMLAIRWLWVAPAILLDILSYVCQGIRWRMILRPVARVTPVRAIQAIYAGLFTNEIFPMRLGEIVRTLLVARWGKASAGSVFPSIAIERLFDAFWLTLTIGFTAIFMPMPAGLVRAADLLGIVVVAGTIVLATSIVRAGRPDSAGRNRRGIAGVVSRFGSDLGRMGRTRSFYGALMVSALVLLFQAVAFWMVMRAYRLDLSLWIGIVALLIVHLGTALPNAPGNVGTYQFFCVVALSFFGVDKARAAGFSIAVFVILTAPLWAIGSLALARSGLSLRGARAEAEMGIDALRRRKSREE